MFTPIPGHLDYGISRTGEVRHLATQNVISPTLANDGTVAIHLPNPGNPSIRKRVALLVAELYVPIPDELRNVRVHVMYKDFNKTNVRADNLYWISYRDSQKLYYSEKCLNYRKRHGLPQPSEFTSERGFAPNPIESSDYPGYYHVPFSIRPLVVNRNGDFIDLLRHASGTVNPRHQYKQVTIHDGDKPRSFPIHRILAALFIERPERHLDKEIHDLQVNHIDGDKHNNSLDNLEWVTHWENIEFARKTGLFDNNISVEVKEISSGKTQIYYSAARCAERHGFNIMTLLTHVNSEFAGSVPNCGHVFRLANQSNDLWPELLFPERARGGFGVEHDIIAVHQTTNEKKIFPNLFAFAAHCGLEKYRVKNHIARKGYGTVFKDWFIWPLADWIRGGGK